MSRKKSGGLASNPLLQPTEPQDAVEATPPEPQSRTDQESADGMPAPQRTDAPTIKFTFYFTDEQLERLDDLWDQVRRRPRGSKQRISKSHVVRVALDRLLDEYDRDPERVTRELRQRLNS